MGGYYKRSAGLRRAVRPGRAREQGALAFVDEAVGEAHADQPAQQDAFVTYVPDRSTG